VPNLEEQTEIRVNDCGEGPNEYAENLPVTQATAQKEENATHSIHQTDQEEIEKREEEGARDE
jgi:hypothetical protein